MRVLSLFALVAPLVSAISFEEPASNSTLKKGDSVQLTWDSVDTDPTVFSIFLVNFVDWPPFYTQVASGVETSAGAYEVDIPCDINTSWGYQFNAINGTNVYVIHAQTPKFFIDDGVCSGPGPNEPVSTCKPVTMTETETETTTVTVTVSATCPVDVPASATPATTTPAAALTSTTVAVPKPEVTNPPSVDDVDQATKSRGITSTIYQTVYKDMSEVGDHCEKVCAAF